MSRHLVGKGDKSFFRHTAAKSKKINIDPKIYRGGIHLQK